MNGNDYWVAGPSAWRKETPAEIGQRFVHTLDRLSTINRNFRSWGFLGMDLSQEQLEALKDSSPEELGLKARDLPLEEWRSRMTEIVEQGVVTDDYGEPEPALGYGVHAFDDWQNVRERTTRVEVNVHGGGNPNTWRRAGFRTAMGVDPDPEIVTYPVIKSVLLTLVSDWDLTYALACCSALSKEWDYPALNFDLQWLTYLSAPLAEQITPPGDVLVEKMSRGSLLLIAAEETFDAANRQHMAAAERIRDALAPLNDLPGHKKRKHELAENWRRMKASGFPGELVTGRRKPFP